MILLIRLQTVLTQIDIGVHMKKKSKWYKILVNFFKSNNTYRYIKIIFILISSISLIITFSRGVLRINKLIYKNEDKFYQHNVSNAENKVELSVLNELDQNDLNIAAIESIESILNNNELDLNNNTDLKKIEERIQKVDNTIIDIKNDIEMLNSKIEDNNNENVIAALITGLFSIIVPLLSLIGQILINKREKNPQSIIIESVANNVYMELRKISYKDNIMDNENVLLVNGNKYESIKVIRKGKKFYKSKRA